MLFGATALLMAGGLNVIETLDITLNADNTNFANQTFRQVFNSSLFTNNGSALRLTFEAHSSSTTRVEAVTLNHAAASGDAYDFESAPTTVTFNDGDAFFEISSGATVVSDTITFNYDSSKNLVVAFHIANDSGKDDVRQVSGLGGNYIYYNKAGGDDTATVDASGYGVDSGRVNCISKVEILN